MSDQSDAVNKKAMEAGILPPEKIAVLREGDDFTLDGRPEMPWVQLPVDGRINNDFNKEMGQILTGKGLYRYNGRLITVATDEKTGRIEIEEMDAHRFRDWAENFLICFKMDFGRKGAIKVKETMKVETAATCLASDGFRKKQPRLIRVNTVRLPIGRSDGGMELLPIGYDDESCILTMDPGWIYDEDMTPDVATHILDDLDREFPFQDARSRAVFRAALFSQYAYFLQPLGSEQMNFLFHANSSRSGKTLLVEIALTIPWHYASMDSMPEKTKDLKDRLDTAVLDAMPYLVLDDLDQTFLRSGTLNTFMTAKWWGGRKFHTQTGFQLPKTPVVFLTANNLDIAPDIAGRVLRCDLFTSEADAQERQIERPISAEWVRQPIVHAQLCSALWTLVKAWRDAGRPHGGRLIAGHQQWSKIFGGLTMHAGFGDPCEAPGVDDFGNSEYSDMLAMISALAENVEKAHEFLFEEIVDICRSENCFTGMLEGKMVKHKDGEEETYKFELTNRANSSFGRLLAKYGGKVFMTKTGKRVMFDKRGKNRHRRYLIKVAEV